MLQATRFSQVGGARVGWNGWLALNFSLPFARIFATDDAIAVRISIFGLGRTYLIKRTEIRRLSVYHGVFVKGLRIECRSGKGPEFLVFWARDHSQLVANLTALNYEVAEG